MRKSKRTTIGDLLDKYPILRIKRKKSWVWFIKPVNKVLRLDTATTTIWRTIYLSTEWDRFSEETKSIILEHEEQHLRQMGVQFGWWGFPIFLVMALFYTLLPLPFFLSGRAFFEGWAFGWSNVWSRGTDSLKYYLDLVCGKAYLFAGPRWLVRKIMMKAYYKRLDHESKILSRKS